MIDRLRGLFSKQRQSEPVDGDTVVFFRIAFGIIAAYWVWKQYSSGAIQVFYVAPRLYFHYWGFGWVNPLADNWIHAEFALLGIAAILIACGAFYRYAALTFAVIFTHLFLADKCLYQNHYYLICLLSWLMIFIPAHRQLAFDAWLRSSTGSQHVPQWTVWLLRFQLALPYFYGGIAKLNSDWLAGEPMGSMLAQRGDVPIIGVFFAEPWCVNCFVFGGLLFDLLFVPAILSNRFRKLACCCAIVFHLMNSLLFTIGVFPWLMLLSLVVFLPPGILRRCFRRQTAPDTLTGDSQTKRFGLRYFGLHHFGLHYLVWAYIGWQLILPLRHFAYVGNTSWTEEGHCFSWRMLVRGKQPALRLIATDAATGKTGAIDLRRYIGQFQLHRVAREPRLIAELARCVAADLETRGYEDVAIRALSLVSLNGRKPQLMIDPRVDLVKERVGWQQPSWIVPLTEPLRDEPWNKPMSEWERSVEIPQSYRRD